MALEPGGYADKLGNRYEGRWIVRQLLHVLNEDLRSVRWEPVGDGERGVDLWVERPNGVRQAQQCKLRNVSIDRWTIADLDRRGILGAMKRHLDSVSSNEFCLVTPISSVLLHDICKSARNASGNPEDYFQHQIQACGEDRRRIFRQFCERLCLNGNSEHDRAKAFSYLKRFFIECWPDTNTSYQDIVGLAQVLVWADEGGNPATVIAVLAEFAQDNLRRTLDAPAIWRYLESQGFHPRRLARDARINPAIEMLQAQFADSISDGLISGSLIQRVETQSILESIKDNSIIVLHGGPGQGKSGVLYELTETFRKENIAYLPIRLDRQQPSNSTRQFGTDLGLPESPVMCLEAIARERAAVLVLDQLDAIRWTSGHSLDALEVCKALIREVKTLKNSGKQACVVMACRTYDLQNDPEIKNWVQAQKKRGDTLVEIPMGPLATSVVTEVVTSLGHNANDLSRRQQDILQSPQHLAMWVGLVQERGTFEFQNRVQLIREYWTSRIREMTRTGVSESDANRVVTSLLDFMEQNKCIVAPISLITDSTALDALCGCGLIRNDKGQITFSHQSYLDYQIASRVVREIHTENRDICVWLGTRNQQSLFRREQLRQALCLLADESPDRFLNTIKVIIANDDIRFHLKHLCLEVTGQLDASGENLLAYLKELLVADEWKEHILGTVFARHAVFVGLLIESGVIPEWLETDKWRDSALWLLRTVREGMPDAITATLRPYMDRGEEWVRRVLACLPWNAQDDSDAMFELRLELARRGVFQDVVDWEKLCPDRKMRLLDAVISRWNPEDVSIEFLGELRNQRSRFQNWTDRDMVALLKSARELPEQTWNLLVPHISRLAPECDEPAGTLEFWQDGTRHGISQNRESVPHGLIRIMVEAGRCMARDNGAGFWERTALLRSLKSPVIQYLLVEVYAHLPEEMASHTICWLLEDDARLRIGSGEMEPEWSPAARLIKALSPHCDIGLFHQLEETIINYHSPNERRDAEYWLSGWNRGFYGDYWGRAQHFLLPALCAERCSDETIGLIGVLQRKYAEYSEDRFVRHTGSRAVHVGSTWPAESLERISDRAWLSIIKNRDIPEHYSHRMTEIGGRATESTVWQFSRDLERMAKRFPERFGRLALRFPDEVFPRYQAAILAALAQAEPKDVPDDEKASWTPASVELVEGVIAQSTDKSDSEYASQFCWLIHNRAEEEWSDAVLQQLVEYACNHADPRGVTLRFGNPDGSFDTTKATVANLETNVLNCVRGVATLAIGRLLWNHSDLLDRFKTVIERICEDRHPAVKMAVVEACLPVLNLDKDFAIACFCKASADDLRVAASRAATHYFNCGMLGHRDQLTTLVKQMLASAQTDVALHGALEVGARWLFHDYFIEEFPNCLRGSVPQRKGLAQIAAQFAAKLEFFEKCQTIITALKDDPDEEVREQLRQFVRTPDILQIPAGATFVQSFIDSQAFRDDPTVLVHALERFSGTLLPFSNVLLAMCDQFVGPLRAATRDVSQGVMYDLSQFLPILVRLYEQAEDRKNTQVVNECLDALDAMFKQRIGVLRELAETAG